MLKHSQGSFNTACCLGHRGLLIVIRLRIIPHLSTFCLPNAPGVNIHNDRDFPPLYLMYHQHLHTVSDQILEAAERGYTKCEIELQFK